MKKIFLLISFFVLFLSNACYASDAIKNHVVTVPDGEPLFVVSFTGTLDEDMIEVKNVSIKWEHGRWKALVLALNGAEFTEYDKKKITDLLPKPWRRGKDGEVLVDCKALN